MAVFFTLPAGNPYETYIPSHVSSVLATMHASQGCNLLFLLPMSRCCCHCCGAAVAAAGPVAVAVVIAASPVEWVLRCFRCMKNEVVLRTRVLQRKDDVATNRVETTHHDHPNLARAWYVQERPKSHDNMQRISRYRLQQVV
jgi:hypothetical protein